MEFMIEIAVTAFAVGGVIGAVVALQLSSNLKQTDTHPATRPDTNRDSNINADRTTSVLHPTPIKAHSELARQTNPRRHSRRH